MNAVATDKRKITVAVKLLSGMWQITPVIVPLDIHGAYRLPLEFECMAYDGPMRKAYVKFLKGNKRGKWFYEEV